MLSPSSFTIVLHTTSPGVCADTLIPEKPKSNVSTAAVWGRFTPVVLLEVTGVIYTKSQIVPSGHKVYLAILPSIVSPESQL